MSEDSISKRKRIMQRSIALGHCVCDVQKPCPCPIFKLENVCECAGERRPMTQTGEVRLTEHVRAAGCASKISKKMLTETLKDLPFFDDPRVLVSSATSDDAGVVALNESETLVMTTDVFTPTVDDPYTFGQIAAANSISDIYAMGAEPLAALSIIGFPAYTLPASAMREMLRGGIEKLAEAGIAVVGGHSLNDVEVKCGFAVVGTLERGKVIRNSTAQVGDMLVLTKALGNGVLSFAHQLGRTTDEQCQLMTASMVLLNKNGAKAAKDLSLHAMTDITGFSLMGHLYECVKQAQKSVEINFDVLPFFDGVKALAQQGVFPGAIERNQESVPENQIDFSTLTSAQKQLLFSPETSGGLLLFLPENEANVYIQRMKIYGEDAVVIGRVTGDDEHGFIRVKTKQERSWQDLKLIPIFNKQEVKMKEEACCCQTPQNEMAHGRVEGAQQKKFMNYMGATMGEGSIDLMYKKLMALALSVAFKCQPCIDINLNAAREAGANEAQIAEAVEMGIAFGGASAMMSYKHG